MKSLLFLCAAFAISVLLLVLTAGRYSNASEPNKPLKIFILAGQSNAVGYNNIGEFHGNKEELDTKLSNVSNILFWPGSNARKEFSGRWIKLRPGVSGISGSPPYNEGCFGPEIGFAMKIAEAIPGEEIAIIKFAEGATGIARSSDYNDYIPALQGFDDKGINFHPPVGSIKAGQLYIDLIQNINAALSALKKEGRNYKISGFLWMQGEHEAGISKTMAGDYEDLLKLLSKSVRKDLDTQDLPFIIGEINSHTWAFGDLARQRQVSFCLGDGHAALVKTVDLPRNGVGDKAHFDADGMITLGERFAKAMLKFLD